jgi:hypothetical protein
MKSVSTAAFGRFRAVVSRDTTGAAQIAYTLSYTGLSSAVQQAHIHFAQQHVNGGIVLFLCQGAVLAPGSVPTPPTCPQEGTVTGNLKAENVLATATTQQIGAGEFAEVLAAIRAGAAYVNVHSATSPGGEFRGQITVLEGGRSHPWWAGASMSEQLLPSYAAGAATEGILRETLQTRLAIRSPRAFGEGWP